MLRTEKWTQIRECKSKSTPRKQYPKHDSVKKSPFIQATSVLQDTIDEEKSSKKETSTQPRISVDNIPEATSIPKATNITSPTARTTDKSIHSIIQLHQT